MSTSFEAIRRSGMNSFHLGYFFFTAWDAVQENSNLAEDLAAIGNYLLKPEALSLNIFRAIAARRSSEASFVRSFDPSEGERFP